MELNLTVFISYNTRRLSIFLHIGVLFSNKCKLSSVHLVTGHLMRANTELWREELEKVEQSDNQRISCNIPHCKSIGA